MFLIVPISLGCLVICEANRVQCFSTQNFFARHMYYISIAEFEKALNIENGSKS